MRAHVCARVARPPGRFLFKRKGTPVRQQAEVKAMVCHYTVTVVSGLCRLCRMHSCADVGTLKWEMQRTAHWNLLLSINYVWFLTSVIVSAKENNYCHLLTVSFLQHTKVSRFSAGNAVYWVHSWCHTWNEEHCVFPRTCWLQQTKNMINTMRMCFARRCLYGISICPEGFNFLYFFILQLFSWQNHLSSQWQ